MIVSEVGSLEYTSKSSDISLNGGFRGSELEASLLILESCFKGLISESKNGYQF